MNYQFLRIDRETIIKVPRKTLGTVDGPVFLFFGEKEDPNEQPLQIGGDMGEAIKAWIGGREFPVVGNGVCDVYGGWVLGREAAAALEGTKLTDVIIDADLYQDNVTYPIEKMPKLVPDLDETRRPANGQPRIDFLKVEKRLRGE